MNVFTFMNSNNVFVIAFPARSFKRLASSLGWKRKDIREWIKKLDGYYNVFFLIFVSQFP